MTDEVTAALGEIEGMIGRNIETLNELLKMQAGGVDQGSLQQCVFSLTEAQLWASKARSPKRDSRK